jgi:ABC-type transport system substrate-binding protein
MKEKINMAKKDTFTFLKYSRFALIFTMIIGLMLVVTACGGDDEEAAPAKAPAKVASQSDVVKSEKPPATEAKKEAPAAAKKEEAKPARVMGGDVPRNKTLVVMPWSDTLGPQLPMPDTYNPYQNGVNHQRHAGEKGMIEFLFYTNLNVGEIIPWIGKKWTYNSTFDSVDVELRDGVKWSDVLLSHLTT